MDDEARKEPQPLTKERGARAEAAFCRWLEGYLGQQACGRCGAFLDYWNGEWDRKADPWRHTCKDGGSGTVQLMLKEEAAELRAKDSWPAN